MLIIRLKTSNPQKYFHKNTYFFALNYFFFSFCAHFIFFIYLCMVLYNTAKTILAYFIYEKENSNT